jgi:hypothetical protein
MLLVWSAIWWRPIRCTISSFVIGRAPTPAPSYTLHPVCGKSAKISISTAIAEWGDDIDQVLVQGNVITTEVVFFHRNSGTVLFTDLIQTFRANWFSGWRAIVARLDLMVAPEPSVPRKFRAAYINRRAARASIAHVLAWSAEKVLMAHGDPINDDGRAFIYRAFHWLNR